MHQLKLTQEVQDLIRREICKARMIRIWWPVWGYSDWRAEVAYHLRMAAYLRQRMARS